MSTVTIVFKSGEKLDIRGSSFKVRHSTQTGEVLELTWSNDSKPNPLYLNPGEIAAVVEGRAS